MALPQLNIHPYERGTRTLITLTGVIGPATAPPARQASAECLSDDIRSRTLRPHQPSQSMAPDIEVTGSEFPLDSFPVASLPVASSPVAGARSGRIPFATGGAR